MTRIFISHSHSDEEIADKLVEFLLSVFQELREEDILHTSDPNSGLLYNSNTISEQLKRSLIEAKALIALITTDSLRSLWIPFEIGSFWPTEKSIVLILGPGLSPSDLPGPLKGWLSIRIEDNDAFAKVNGLMNQLETKLGIRQNVHREIRDRKLKEFITLFTAWESKLSETDVPQQKEVKNLKTQIQELKQELAEARSHEEQPIKRQIAEAAEIAQLLSTNDPIKSLILSIKVANQLIKTNEKIQDSLRYRLFEAIDVAREQNRLEHSDKVYSVDVHPNGELIITGCEDGNIRLWNKQGKLIDRQLGSHRSSAINSVAFSPNGEYFVSGCADGTVKLWRYNNQLKKIKSIAPFKDDDPINSVSFCPNGKYIVTGCAGGHINILKYQENSIDNVISLQRHKKYINQVVWSIIDDRNLIASAGEDDDDDYNIKLWKVNLENNTLKPIKKLSGHEEYVNGIAFSPDGKYIVSGSADNTLRWWSFKDDSEAIEEIGDLRKNEIPPLQSLSLLFNWVIGKLFKRKSLEKIEIEGHTDDVMCVAFSSKEKLLASGGGSLDHSVRIWNSINHLAFSLMGHTTSIRSVAFSQDGSMIVSGSEDGTARIWDLQKYTGILPFQGHMTAINAIAISPNGEYIVTGSAGGIGTGGTLRLWDSAGNMIGSPGKGHTKSIRAVDISLQGDCIASGSEDKTVRLWDFEGNPIGEPFKGHKNIIRAVAFGHLDDQECIASASTDGTIKFWNRSGDEIGALKFQDDSSTFRSIAFSPTNPSCLVSCCDDGSVQIWNLKSQKLEYSNNEAHSQSVRSIAFSPNGEYFATGSADTTICLWDLQGNPKGTSFKGHLGIVRKVIFIRIFNPIENKIQDIIASAGDDGTIRLWTTPDGKNIYTEPQAHDDSIRAMAFSPNGQYIVSGSSDKTIKLWKIENDKLNAVFTPQDIKEEWFKVACNRLRFHPVFKHPKQFFKNPEEQKYVEICQEACEICRKFSE